MSKEIEKLERELAELKRSNRDMWDTYGSELCAGDMIRQEEKLEEKITKLKHERKQYFEDPKYIIDD